ncbi:MAG: deoxyguanosinetriphosphate triphosphohydrolase [Bacteroidales bacterium]|nr:deoxyguanosinetriphosphate triphosphohydrolase [Candidatus Scybalocola fimicaballi]
MEWNKLICTIRLGLEDYHDPKEQDRTEFQRDYDRLVFSAPFRRLQNKTQVFPLPNTIFVHNRLTHSLEVSCVGRSIGNRVSKFLKEKYGSDISEHVDDLGSIVSAACLAHDMGNPPFGHSGETAISSYFSEGAGMALKDKYSISDEQWADFTHFDGNANAFRLLTHRFEGRRNGGFVLTYPTLLSIVKYPYIAADVKGKKNKFGFFQDDFDTYKKIADYLGIKKKADGKYSRHPLVYLVEAADDICYEIMDIEDALKMRLLDKDETFHLLLAFFPEDRQERIKNRMTYVDDVNEQVAYLRSCVIGVLIEECSDVFLKNEEKILAGEFEGSLIDYVSDRVSNAYKECQRISFNKIYKSKEVVDIEIAGYNIIYTLIDKEIEAVFNADKAYSKQLLARIPSQFAVSAESPYERILAVLDHVSGMTDVYALDLYRKIQGISLPTM